jgi:rare lipoprotein A
VPLPPPANGPAADYPVVLGDPFTIDGVTYTPADTWNYDAVGHALSGREGGSSVSAAHRTLPLPSYVEVTSLETGKTILVRLERRGPMSGNEPGGTFARRRRAAGHRRAADARRVRRVNPPEVERALLRAGQPAPARLDTPNRCLPCCSASLTCSRQAGGRPAHRRSATPKPGGHAASRSLPPGNRKPKAVQAEAGRGERSGRLAPRQSGPRPPKLPVTAAVGLSSSSAPIRQRGPGNGRKAAKSVGAGQPFRQAVARAHPAPSPARQRPRRRWRRRGRGLWRRSMVQRGN